MCGLQGRDHYAFTLFLLPPGVRCGDGRDYIVFIDKNEKRVLGLFNTDEFKGNPIRNQQKTDKEILLTRSDYDQSIDIAKRYLVENDYYEHENKVSLLYDPANGYWKRHISWKPESVEACGLSNKIYDAIEFGVLDSGKDLGFIFVDKNDERVIGIFYYHDNRYIENDY